MSRSQSVAWIGVEKLIRVKIGCSCSNESLEINCGKCSDIEQVAWSDAARRTTFLREKFGSFGLAGVSVCQSQSRHHPI